ncbi:hypothetical protein DXG03_001974 [Asterophora parasitica]|uniref:Uncharacterized protein n=1 Tax=Asterophora parasitica TaxID=117018 RepID=A0A9P7GBA0_9AGAR|nr:hypothetical protein DXG03_001974 [Asterophora parasitica]
MSLRHLSRQNDRDRPHDTPAAPHPIVTHLNGATSTPAVPNASPAASSTAPPNGVSATSSVIQKLNVANEQTWLLIGMSSKCLQRLCTV